MIYFLNRFANLSWKIDLCQMWLISLLFLPLSCALLTIPYGIQVNSVAKEDLNSECSLCYEDDGWKRTFSINIINCAGPVLFVGGTVEMWWPSNKMQLGAFALASEVHQTTVLNTPHLSNGVYWYFTPGKSFGFLKDDTLEQATADIGTTNPASRLSWNLSKYGGYRSGLQIVSGWPAGTYRKRIYNCPLMII